MRLLVSILLWSAAVAYGATELHGLGFVNRDGSLQVDGRRVYLHGVYLPLDEEYCYAFLRPVRCGPGPVLALELKVDGFVRCQPAGHRADGAIEAVCRVGGDAFSPGEDLAAHLLRQGWALARPGAPFEYHALERIARERHIGIWGIPAISRRR